MWHPVFSVYFTGSKFIIPEKRSCISNTASNNSQNMFIIYVIDLSTKNKLKRRGFIVLQKSKMQTVGKRKKM